MRNKYNFFPSPSSARQIPKLLKPHVPGTSKIKSRIMRKKLEEGSKLKIKLLSDNGDF